MNRPEDEFRQLVGDALDGIAGEEDARRLVSACRDDQGLAKDFGDQMEVDRLLEIALRDRADDSFSRGVMQRIGDGGDQGGFFVESVMGKVRKTSGPGRRWRFAGIGMAAALILWLGFSIDGFFPAAQLHRDDAAKWSKEHPVESLKPGSRLKLESGLAEVHFRNGAELILEGPADFEIRGKGAGFLHRGRASVRVDEGGAGFTLDSPGGRLVDLGTAFGVHVGSDGETEAEVFEGKVQVRPKGRDEKVVLARNEKFTADHSGWRKTRGINANAFVTNLPPQPERLPRYVHWALDEGQGDSTVPDGVLASGRLDPAMFRNFNEPGDPFPRWINGPYGTAVSFDGRGQALETYFPGPAGDSARTVAFWLRLPENFDPDQGYGIISWGDLSEAGNAWQISVNPYLHEGPVGMLRVGIFPSLVTGSTDLRDGRWHHCAVVLYQDQRDESRIPILLYVDGKMEATAAKGIFGRIHTSTDENSRAVWIAKSLRHLEPGRSRGTGFFKGDLDEIYIFDQALNQRQIENLMRSNIPPSGATY